MRNPRFALGRWAGLPLAGLSPMEQRRLDCMFHSKRLTYSRDANIAHIALAFPAWRLPSPTVQANVDGGNGFIGTSGFFGWDFYTQDSSTGRTRFTSQSLAHNIFQPPFYHTT